MANLRGTARVSSHHGVMIEVNSTGDSSVTEVQVFQFLQFRNGRWHLCDAPKVSSHHGLISIGLSLTRNSGVFEVKESQIHELGDGIGNRYKPTQVRCRTALYQSDARSLEIAVP